MIDLYQESFHKVANQQTKKSTKHKGDMSMTDIIGDKE